jgi:hypothetical protein
LSIHLVAASFEDGASARLATSANRIRSTRGSIRVPASIPRIAASIPSRRHSPSNAYAPPRARDAVNRSSADALAASASPGSSSRHSAAISRRIPAVSSWSSRPKEYSTLVRDVFAAASHSLWASCR